MTTDPRDAADGASRAPGTADGDRQLSGDGGSPTPGVPGADESDDSASGTGNRSSEAGMPGVPDADEAESEEPTERTTGTETHSHQHHDEDAGGEHDLTTAFTLAALTELADPAAVVAEAGTWSDWVGVVGEVDAPTLNTFLRREAVDNDFFNGVEAPTERLKRIANPGSAFYSERLVLVGTEDQAEIAAAAGWEFEAVRPTAEEAGWELA
jgi:hypothetical protein